MADVGAPADATAELARPRFPQRGGHVALDFANTVGWHASDSPYEWLTDYPALLAWAWQASVLPADHARRLLGVAAREPAEAAAALERARGLREVIYRIFTAVSRGARAAPGDMRALDVAYAAASDHLHLAWHRDGPSWEWAFAPGALDAPLWPVARAAAELLTGEERRQIRECGGEGCGWLFLDESRRGNRRWCSMGDCGNRAKARRHRARRRGAAASA